ncbi:hypothetical protein Droror1_Dr00019060 [Drosera rotundifolia]
MDEKSVSGTVVSSRPVSLSKAAKILSDFATMDNGVSPAMTAYLKLAVGSFNDLVMFHKELKASSRKGRSGGGASSSSAGKGNVDRRNRMASPIPYGGGGDKSVIPSERDEGREGVVADGVKMLLKKDEIVKEEEENAGGEIVRESERHSKRKKRKEKEGAEGDKGLFQDRGKDEMKKKHKEEVDNKVEDQRLGLHHEDRFGGHGLDAFVDNGVRDSDRKHSKKEKKRKIKEEVDEDLQRIEGNEGKKHHVNKIENLKAEVKTEVDGQTEVDVKAEAEGKTEGGEVDLKIKESIEKQRKKKNKNGATPGEGKGGNIEDVKMEISKGELAIAKDGNGIEPKTKDSERKRHKKRNKDDEAVKREDGAGTELRSINYADGKQEVKGPSDEKKRENGQHVNIKSENQESRKRKTKEIKASGLDDSVEQQRPHKKKRKNKAND